MSSASFSDLGFENGPNRLYFVGTWLYMSFLFCRSYTSYFSTSPWWGWGHAIPPFLISDSKMGSIVCISLLHDCIHLFSFVHFLFFFLPLPEEAGDMLSTPFLILDSKMGSIVCISLVHDCIHLFSFVLPSLLLLSSSCISSIHV